MFKSSFAKYLTTFIVIILVSFLTLSGIITSMIQSFVTNELEVKLESTGTLLVQSVEKSNIISVSRDIGQIVPVVEPLTNFDKKFEVIVTDSEGDVCLTTVSVLSDAPVVDNAGRLGHIDVIKMFLPKEYNDGSTHFVHRGDLGGFLDGQYLVYAVPIMTGGTVRGYIMTLSSTVGEDNLVSHTRRAVITSSIWVMLAAVIAAYFITERIIHPLRTMTGAAKKFAKGDFSARVTVYGHDEVSELAAAFNNMAESLDNLEKMRNSFLANISHDLRTPMTTIAGFIDGINSGAIPPEKHEYYLGVISAEVHRLSRLVSQILDVSRLESGERKFNFTDFDVAEMARIILISFESKIDEKRLDIEFESDSDEMCANADKDAIYQVLYNLCHNAIKFSREGGKLRISLVREGGKIKVTVFDEGQSLNDEDKKMVFERFYKSDKSRGLDRTAAGLGLYICKTIIDAHGENIGVESSEGECEFYFTVKEGCTPNKRKALTDGKNAVSEE